MRVIDADALIEKLDAEPEGGYYSPHDVISLLMTQPTIEERKTGMWLRAEFGVECNLCKGNQMSMTPYYSHCGAEMDC